MNMCILGLRKHHDQEIGSTPLGTESPRLSVEEYQHTKEGERERETEGKWGFLVLFFGTHAMTMTTVRREAGCVYGFLLIFHFTTAGSDVS